MMAKTESDFRGVFCQGCGTATGSFYIDTDDHEILCLDCVMELPSAERVELDEALADSRNWQLYRRSGGKVTLECVHCGDNHPELGYGDEGDDDFLVEMTDILRADIEHDCDPEDEPDDEAEGDDDA